MSERVALAVDDAPANRDFLEKLLIGARFQVIGANTGEHALDALKNITQLDVVVADWKLPDMTGLELVTKVRMRFPNTYTVIATMYDNRSMMDEAFAAGCNVFLVKPHGFMELLQRLMSTPLEALRASPALIIDQFGPRNYKRATSTMTMPRVTTDSLPPLKDKDTK